MSNDHCAYAREKAIEYQANAGQTAPQAEETAPIYTDYTPAPDPGFPLPISMTLSHAFAERGFAIDRIGRLKFLPGVTAQMLDWFWANMEKGYYLWAPGEHKSFRWLRAPGTVGFLNSAHEIVEPAGPVMMRVQISRLDPAEWFPYTECLDHVICEGIYNDRSELNDATIHMWQDTDGGCIHITSAIKNTRISRLPGCIQALKRKIADYKAAHTLPDVAAGVDGQPEEPDGSSNHWEYESSRWPVFLPTLYHLWEGHPDPAQNVPCDLTVRKLEDGRFHYINM